MIDPNLIRENPAQFIRIIESGRGNREKANIKRWLELDKNRSLLIQNLEELNRNRNAIAEIGKINPELARTQGRDIKEKIINAQKDLDVIQAEWQEILDWVPNIPLNDVPKGVSEEENQEIKAWHPAKGYLSASEIGGFAESGRHMGNTSANTNTEPKPHWEIGEKLKIIDLEAGAKVAGSRFYYLKNEGALIIYAIFNLLTRKLVQEGFSPMIVPVLVKDKALYGSSHFPGDADQVYKLESKYVEGENQLYLLGSSEPANFGYFMDSVLSESELPIKVMAQSTCFRSEVGSWGKDVRGMKRTHQFDKLEMNMIIKADEEEARKAHEYLLGLNEWLLQELKLPYHVINMCIGDLGYYAAAKKYDVEVWLPSSQSYMEVMSDSITTDYQSRRLNLKYKDQNGSAKYAYTLNDTGATHRLLIAIIEHYQLPDGKIKVPEALQAYIGKEIIG